MKNLTNEWRNIPHTNIEDKEKKRQIGLRILAEIKVIHELEQTIENSPLHDHVYQKKLGLQGREHFMQEFGVDIQYFIPRPPVEGRFGAGLFG
ncbi:MAG: hypothetical protein ACLFR0_06590 [Alphaproteobacteria bacterium]